MSQDLPDTYAAFAGARLLATGELRAVLRSAKEHFDSQGYAQGDAQLLIFDESGRQVEFDLRGSVEEVLAREAPEPVARPGRPKLGVVSREVSLLPRHWEWLEREPNGISAALRRLVEEASKREPEKQRARHARDAAGRMMSSLAGDLPNYEEASRALYAGDEERFRRLVKKWPVDVRNHLLNLSAPAFAQSPE